MEKREKRILYAGILCLVLFIVWTVLIQTVDVQPAGESRTEIGFAAFNRWFHELTGVHMGLYYITDWLGLVPLFICIAFGGYGFRQLVQRKSLLRVDFDILLLGIYYGIAIFGYLIFEMIPINYRPILIGGIREASYPSSTTLLVLSVLPTLVFQTERRLGKEKAKKAIRFSAILFSVFMVLGRLISGVHWFTDIVGSVLFSGGLFCLYQGCVILFEKKEKDLEVLWWNLVKSFRN